MGLCYNKFSHSWLRGYSSVGRAFEWHSKGRRFDPDYLHHARTNPNRGSLASEARHLTPRGRSRLSPPRGQHPTAWAINSAGEYPLDVRKVTGSNPVLPTKLTFLGVCVCSEFQNISDCFAR